MKALLDSFLAREGGVPSDANLVIAGWDPAWVPALGAALAVLVWLGYRRGAPALPPARRRTLAALRTAFFSLLLLLLLRPEIFLTVVEPARGNLAVLVDDSASMGQADRRTQEDDRRRLGVAAGGSVSEEPVSRHGLLRAISDNRKLRLWERLHKNADLAFFRFDGTLRPLGVIRQGADVNGEVGRMLSQLSANGSATAAGDALRGILDAPGGGATTGIVVITDGNSNRGMAAEEAAAMAAKKGVPIYPYGIGITAPNDFAIREISGPPGVFRNEFVEFAVRIHASGYGEKTLKFALKENGRTVKEDAITVSGSGEQTLRIGYEPQVAGEFAVSASIEPEPDEAALENNVASTRLRVLDGRLDVLYLEQEPRWDFRYLLAGLERDPRLRVQCLLYDGDPIRAGEEGMPFIKEFPSTRAGLVKNAVLIIGDVSPAEIGEPRMKLIREWVSDLGGAIIFLAGPKNNPSGFGGTPLEPLLPVEINPALAGADSRARRKEPVPLVLTPAGEESPMLRLSPDRQENQKIWREFPGVRWIASVVRARAGAQVLLEAGGDLATRGRMPVVATMPYGQGAVLYFGFDETYRWRSRTGEKYYAAIWNQIIQQFAIDRWMASSQRIQLQADRREYPVGAKARIGGKIFDEDFRPLAAESVAATLTFRDPTGRDLPPRPVRLLAVPGSPGNFALDVELPAEGAYTLVTSLDPAAAVRFDARDPRLESADTAMNEPALRALAELSGGEFFREENLEALPEHIVRRSASLPVLKKYEIAYSPWWLPALLLPLFAEWLMRRLWNLK